MISHYPFRLAEGWLTYNPNPTGHYRLNAVSTLEIRQRGHTGGGWFQRF